MRVGRELPATFSQVRAWAEEVGAGHLVYDVSRSFATVLRYACLMHEFTVEGWISPECIHGDPDASTAPASPRNLAGDMARDGSPRGDDARHVFRADERRLCFHDDTNDRGAQAKTRTCSSGSRRTKVSPFSFLIILRTKSSGFKLRS